MELRRRLEELEREGRPIRVGLIGVGQMGRGLIAQVAGIPGMAVVAAADVDVERAGAAFRAVGAEPGPAGTPDRPLVTRDAGEVAGSPAVDVVVEATGLPEVGARAAFEAIQEGRHVVMLNVEADITVGALLSRMARSAGVVYTGSAGDEPGAVMELYDFARTLGFEVVAAGKGKNNPLDLTATPESVAEESAAKHMNPKMLASFVDGTKTMVEMGAVANATGLVPDVAGMHGPEETRPSRLAEIFRLRAEGGILGRDGIVDYVRGVAPGVFVIVRSADNPVRDTLAYVGQGEGPTHVLYRPYHLTSLETPISVARAAIHGEATIAPLAEPPRAEIVAVAKRDLAVGETLDAIGSADYHGWLHVAEEARGLLPIGIAAGARVRAPVARGEAIPRAAVDLDGASFVVRLRDLQDATLDGAGG
jgi:predicted homoserine dehydrogenase-like protein